MGVGKKKAAQKRLKAQAAHAARVGKHASPMGKLVMQSQGVGPSAFDPRSLSPAAARARAAGQGQGDDDSDAGDGPLGRAPDADSDDDDLSSLASDDLEHMAYGDLQRKLAKS